MVPTTDFIAAIELGSSKIAGIAGKKGSDGSIQVLAYASEPSSAFIKKGVIFNLDKTAQALTSIINQLESKLDCGVGKVYVGISGRSLHTEKNVIVRDLREETIISQEMVDEICEENYRLPLTDSVILEAIPQEYTIGINQQVDPVGVAGKHIEGSFLNILARTSVKKNLLRSFEQAKLEIADTLVSPLALAQAVLSGNEMRSGCALVDFGADTTSVSIYKNNILRFLTVIPLGGNNITLDISSLQIEEDEAEEIKRKYGKALLDDENNEDQTPIKLRDGRSIMPEQLNDIIEARAEEIITNVICQIELSDYKDKLFSGAILTGGGANLKKMDELFRKKSRIMKVRVARAIRNEIYSSQSDSLKNGTWNTLLGLLYAGEDNCNQTKPEAVEAPMEVQEPETEPEIKAVPRSLFEHDPDLIDQEEVAREAKRKRKEEDRRKKAEEKARKEAERLRKKQEDENKPKWYEKGIEKITGLFTQDNDDEM